MARKKLTKARKDLFLCELEASGNVSRAARVIDMGRSSLYERRAADPEFKSAWRDALDAAMDGLEEEARRRAIEGTEEPVFYQGKQVGRVRKYSDALLMFLLRAHRPARFDERHGEAGAGPVIFELHFDDASRTETGG